jgi:putative ABC transport system permease protein
MSIRRAVERLLAPVRKRRLDRELESEIAAHLELAERDGLHRGLSPAQARREARLSFGGIEVVKEEHRDRRSFRWMETLARDFRFGFSSLIRAPGFAVVAVGVLALGIGASTAMFSVVDAVLLKPLPYPEPERLVTVVEADGGQRWGVSAGNFVDWKRLSTTFAALTAQAQSTAPVIMGSVPERWDGYLVSADHFKVYGVKALLGRTFLPGEDQPGAERVLVISHALWQTRFGGEASILNRRLLVGGEAHRIVGVLPPGSFDREQGVYWKPLIFTPAQLTRESMWLVAVGRLRAGVSLTQARDEMLRVSAGLEAVNPYWKKGWRAVVDLADANMAGDRLRQMIWVTAGVVAMVLLIACSNIGNLLLARGAARRKEMAVRAALGAGRGRLIGQLVGESLALCTLGGAAGVALAYVLVGAARPLLARTLPPTAEVAMDPRVLWFAVAAILGVCVLVGFLPALQTSSGALSTWLNSTSRGSSGSRALLRRAIVVGEVAVSLVLVCGAVLMFRSLLNLRSVNIGVRMENVIATSVDLPTEAHPKAESVIQFARTVVERLQAVPGVERAAVSTGVSLEGWGEGGVVVAPGLARGGSVNVRIKHVDQNYFAALDIPVLSGRGFDERDRRGAPRVVVVNQELAAQLRSAGGPANPVGKVIGLSLSPYGTTQAELAQVQVVGEIRTERIGDLQSPAEPAAYVPFAQEPVGFMNLTLRTRREPAGVIPGVREAIRELDRGLPLGPVSTLREIKERSFTDTTQTAWLTGVFAALAALLAACGLYGVLAQSVTQQRRETGIRIALGAAPRTILSGVVRNAMGLVAVGLGIGLAGAFALTGVMRSLLFQVPALDPLAFAIACASMTLVGLAAVLVPASRAARVDPVTSLREEG